MATADVQAEFLSRIDASHGIARLFDFLPSVHLFVKNRQSEFIKVSPANMALLGVVEEADVIGKSDAEFFAPEVAKRYMEEDRKVMESGVPSIDQVWLVPDSRGTLCWYLCSKVPLRSRDGSVIGIAGTLQSYERAGSVLEPYRDMAEVLRHLEVHHAQAIKVEDLAKLVHLSTSQFVRRFKQLFHQTPIKYLHQIRLNHACKALAETSTKVTQIAVNVGYCDHSYFTKRFVQHLGMTPSQYRTQFRGP